MGTPALSAKPRRALAVVACMDTRIELYSLLGIERGDAHIIRNAGGLITDDVMRSLVVSQRFLETNEIVVVMHESCGMLGADKSLGGFDDLAAALRDGLSRLREAPELPARDKVRGLIYNPDDGSLREVDD